MFEFKHNIFLRLNSMYADVTNSLSSNVKPSDVGSIYRVFQDFTTLRTLANKYMDEGGDSSSTGNDYLFTFYSIGFYLPQSIIPKFNSSKILVYKQLLYRYFYLWTDYDAIFSCTIHCIFHHLIFSCFCSYFSKWYCLYEIILIKQ